MGKQKQLKNKLLQRDNNLCGIHWGGCGKHIGPGQGNIDHIIPMAYANGAFSRHQFDKSWNKQPTHITCNSQKAGQLLGWPTFQCRCHYLQIIGESLYICTQEADGGSSNGIGNKRYLFVPRAVGQSVSGKEINIVPGLPGGSAYVMSQDEGFGHCFTLLTVNDIHAFNRAELDRANGIGMISHSHIPSWVPEDASLKLTGTFTGDKATYKRNKPMSVAEDN